MNQKHKHFKLNRYIVSTFVLIVVLAGSYFGIMIKQNRNVTAAPIKRAATTEVKSQFKFKGARQWRQGPTRITDMALFHDIQDSCFTSIQHKTGSIDAEKNKREKDNAGLVSNGYTVKSGTALTVTLETNIGLKSYQLQQFDVTTPVNREKVLGGLEFGFLPLSENDYIFVEGHCQTSEQLEATIQALQAIEFDSSKSTASN